MPGRVLEMLEEVLGVQKRMWLRPSRSCRAGDARGGTAKLGSGSATWRTRGETAQGWESGDEAGK
jgi:hypothetical protein